MRDLCAPDDSGTTPYHYTYTFTNGDASERIAFVTDTENREIADRLAWEELADAVEKPVADAQDAWNLSRVGICFADPPWESRDDLHEELGDLDGVQYARKLPHLEPHKPPVVHVVPEAGVAPADVNDAIAEFFDPLPREIDGDRVTVYPTALLNITR